MPSPSGGALDFGGATAAPAGMPYTGNSGHMVGMAAQVQLWQGQFPPPEAVERFERIQPGAFNRMIAMAEFAQSAQAADIKRAHDYAQRDTRRGQILGACTTLVAMLLTIACVGLGVWTKTQGPFYIAGLFLSVPVMAVGNKLVESARSPGRSSSAP